MIDPMLYARLQKLCLRSFPERLGQRISQVRSQSDPRHLTVECTLSWRQGRQLRTERLLLRHYADLWTWWSPTDACKAEREWQLMRWLYAEGLAVPRVYAVESDPAGDAILVSQTIGRGFETLSGASRAQQHVAVDCLTATVTRLHRLPPPQAVREVLPQVSVKDQRTRLENLAHQIGHPGLMEAIDELSAEVQEHPPCVIHGDLSAVAILYDARGITAVIAWENSALGDPRWDIACVASWVRHHLGADQEDRFCQTYAQQTALDLGDLCYWEAVIAVQRWATGLALLDAGAADALRPQVAIWAEQAWRGITRWRTMRASG